METKQGLSQSDASTKSRSLWSLYHPTFCNSLSRTRRPKRQQISKATKARAGMLQDQGSQMTPPVSEVGCMTASVGREHALERQQAQHTLSLTHSSLVTLSSKAFIIIRFSPAPVVMDFFKNNANRKPHLPFAVHRSTLGGQAHPFI